MVALFVVLVPADFSCSNTVSPDDYYHSRIGYEARPYKFDYFSWHINTLYNLSLETLLGKRNARETEIINHISDILSKNGIKIMPPVNFTIEKPPYLLVVSKRDKITYYDRVVLSANLSDADMETLEFKIDSLGLSSLVVDLGGFGGTYPPIVCESSDARFMIESAIEEWFHQYLVFRPLGFLYLLDSLGIYQDTDVITMNETLAGIVRSELGSEVYETYYKLPAEKDEKSNAPGANIFDFNAEMRKTREQVDIFLARGDIARAENYMQLRRDFFLSYGYYIRKLNQAYFAFHSIYAYDPASVSPIYDDLRELRDRSVSLKEFIDTVSAMSSYADLESLLNSETGLILLK